METVKGLEATGPTGVFFQEQTAVALSAAVKQFEAMEPDTISAQACRENAERFSNERFRKEFTDFVTAKWFQFQNEMRVR